MISPKINKYYEDKDQEQINQISVRSHQKYIPVSRSSKKLTKNGGVIQKFIIAILIVVGILLYIETTKQKQQIAFLQRQNHQLKNKQNSHYQNIAIALKSINDQQKDIKAQLSNTLEDMNKPISKVQQQNSGPTNISPLAQNIRKRIKNSEGKTIQQVLYTPAQLKQRQQSWNKRYKIFTSSPNLNNLHYPIFTFKTNNSRDQQEIQLFKKDYIQMQRKYNVNNYRQLPICVIAPGFNNNKDFRIQKNLNSVFLQNYTNYRIVITDDASDDGTSVTVQKYLKFYNISQDKAIFVKNTQRMMSGYTMYHAITKYCDKQGITISVDGDDQIIGRNVFKMTNAVYQKERIGVMWTNFVQYNQKSGFAVPIPMSDYTPQDKATLNFRYANRYSHLKSFRTELFHKIPLPDMQYKNGSFYGYATDVVFYQPMLQIACGRIKWVNQFQYVYNWGTGLNQPPATQRGVAQQVWARPKLPCWQDFKKRMQNP